jgi:uncharacterized DUF497 family protein
MTRLVHHDFVGVDGASLGNIKSTYKKQLRNQFKVRTIIHVDITYDPNKDGSNQVKHGVSLSEAANIDWDTALETLDDRNDYAEDRYQALGFIGNRLYCVVYVDRDDGRRIISLRKANNREYKEYENSY